MIPMGLVVLALACTSPTERPTLNAEEMAVMWDVQAAIEDHRYVAALSLMDSILQEVPDWAELYALKGHVLSDLYRFEEAESNYSQARVLNPDAQGIAFIMGNNAFFVSRYRDALAYYEAERNIVSRSDTVALSAVWAQTGRVYHRLGVLDSAITAYEMALEYSPSTAQTWAWLAELYEDQGALDEALEYAQRAVALDVSNPEYNYVVGRLNYQTGQLSDVESHLSVTLMAQPWHVGAHYNMARYLLAQDRPEEAAYFLEETDRLQVVSADVILARFAVQNNPLGVEEWIVLADLYGQAGRHQERREALQIARQLD